MTGSYGQKRHLAVLATVGITAVATAGTAAAGDDGQRRVTYDDCETISTFTVPSGVHELVVDVAGAQGGDGGALGATTPAAGGTAGAVIANIAVTPGQQFTTIVGCSSGHGINTGVGFTDGGPHGRARGLVPKDGGVGGGSSALVTGPAGSSGGIPMVVAAGGGGGGGDGISGQGGDGGNAGVEARPGQGGAGDGAGDGGCAACVSGPIGGSGTDSNALENGGGGGGGGGGWPMNGGGGHGGDEGGGGGGGGGGGANYADPSISSPIIATSDTTGDGVIIIAWTAESGDDDPAALLDELEQVAADSGVPPILARLAAGAGRHLDADRPEVACVLLDSMQSIVGVLQRVDRLGDESAADLRARAATVQLLLDCG